MSGARPEPRADEGLSRVEVDGLSYAVRFHGFGADLEVHAPVVARLAPWTLAAHLAALDRHAAGSGHLDRGAFCTAVLAACCQSPQYALRQAQGDRSCLDPVCPERSEAESKDALQPLALWWATCGGAEPVAEGDAVRCGPVRVRLRAWTLRERSRALAAAARRRGGVWEFLPGRYLAEMARSCVVAVEPELPVAELPGAVPLVTALVQKNVAPPEEDLGDDHLRQITLRLCAALGWTPERVWSTPAAEVDRLLRLLAHPAPHAERRTPPWAAPRSRSLAHDPDAVVIQVEDG